MTPLEQEIEVDHESWLERINIHLENMLDKANKEKNMFRHMSYHYLARNKVWKTRIRNLKAMLKKESKRRKKHDRI